MTSFSRATLLIAAAAALAAPPAADAGTRSCPVPPSRPDRPFFVPGAPARADVRAEPSDGTLQPGVPLEVRFVVRDVGRSCRAVPDARIDLWSANASGVHSGVAASGTAGKLFLRGNQTTGDDGSATFTTIMPGWFPGRAVHLDFQVAKGGRRLVSQLVFDPAVTRQVLAVAPYSTRGAPDTTNASDDLVGPRARRLLLGVTGSAAAGYRGTATIGFGRPSQVDAEVTSVTARRLGGLKVVQVRIDARETIVVSVRASRGGRVLSRRRTNPLGRGERLVNLVVPPGTSRGSARVTVTLRDRTAHTATTRRTVTVPG